MSRKIKAIKIDAEKRTIEEIEIEKDNLFSYYKALDCSLIEKVTIDEYRDCIIDEEGWIRPDRKPYGFKLPTYSEPLIGHGLIVGYTPDGSWTDHGYNQVGLFALMLTMRFFVLTEKEATV